MSRRELREQIFKLLFRVEFNGREEMPEQEQLFFEQFSYEDEEILVKDSDARYISEKSSKIIDRLEEIDEMINKQAKGWTTQRMGKVDLTILRLAVYEIIYDEWNLPSVMGRTNRQDLSMGFWRNLRNKMPRRIGCRMSIRLPK